MIDKEHLLEPLNRAALEIATHGGPRHRHAVRREPLQHERLLPRRGRPRGRARDVRGAGRLDGRGRRRHGRRRDVLLGRGGAHRARRHPRDRAAVGDHPVDPPRARGPRGLEPGGDVQAPGRRRRRRRGRELHPRAEDDAAAARRDPRGRRLPRRRAARPVPHERGRAELPVADRRRMRLRAAGRAPVPHRARSAAHATATRSPSSPATPTRSARPTSASAAATRRT